MNDEPITNSSRIFPFPFTTDEAVWESVIFPAITSTLLVVLVEREASLISFDSHYED